MSLTHNGTLQVASEGQVALLGLLGTKDLVGAHLEQPLLDGREWETQTWTG